MAPTLVTAVLTPRRWLRRLRRALPLGKARPLRAVAPRRPAAGIGWAGGLVSARTGTQRRGGVVVDQVDGTTCGSTVLVVLRAAADPAYRAELMTGTGSDGAGFGARLDEAQRRTHRESTRYWPRALGTSPWGMAGWLRRRGVLGTRIRLVDAADPGDLSTVVAEVAAALAGGAPVPLLVGGVLPRHWCLALPGDPAVSWLAFEPTSGQVRRVPAAAVLERRLRPLLGFDDLQAVLLPAR